MDPGPLPRLLLSAERRRDGSWQISYRLSTGLVGWAHLADGWQQQIPVEQLLEAIELRLPGGAAIAQQPPQLPAG